MSHTDHEFEKGFAYQKQNLDSLRFKICNFFIGYQNAFVFIENKFHLLSTLL